MPAPRTYVRAACPAPRCRGSAADQTLPDLVVLAATLPENLEPLTALARRAPLALAGPGATPQIASAVGARLLTGDPVTEAENVVWPR